MSVQNTITIYKLLRSALTINSINIAPKVNAVTVSIGMCDGGNVQLEKSTQRSELFHFLW
jgi:hypothetical protein